MEKDDNVAEIWCLVEVIVFGSCGCWLCDLFCVLILYLTFVALRHMGNGRKKSCTQIFSVCYGGT